MATDPVLDIFSEAVDLPEAERSGFLDRACAGDASLRRKVESLLSHDAAADDQFLTPPIPDPRLDLLLRQGDDTADLVGRSIGNYSIRSRIASGGMGTVYLAEQSSPKREVALKVLHGGFSGGALRKRFEREAQILGQLRHPNIAQIHEAGSATFGGGEGTSRRVSYFAMEYVPGAATITQYAKASKLDLRQRLKLLGDVCEAVHHGHQRGIVHRDLKPGNILVDDAGRPKIIDFGVARVTDSDIAATTMQTDVGQLVGTLAYMSPEQCAADPREIHTPSDVYSLGVVLYELLTDRLPYDLSNRTIHAAMRVICEQAPTPPSRFDRHLRGDLETIILKAIEKDRAKRYASVAALGDDLWRWLHGEPIAARPRTRLERWLSAVALRPKTSALIGSLSVVSLVIGATYLLWFLALRRPHHLTGIPDNNEVQLIAFNKQILHTWQSNTYGLSHAASFLKQPPALGGRTLAIIGFPTEDSVWPGRLCAFDVDGDREQPVWEVGISDPDLPDDQEAESELFRRYCPRVVAVADVFPESPGDEVICVFSSRKSQCALCIFDSDRKLLYRVWQDGGIGSIFWMAEAGLIIAGGGDEHIKTAATNVAYAPIVMAIKPRLDFRSREYLTRTPSGGLLDPVWYKYLQSTARTGQRIYIAELNNVGLTTNDGRRVSCVIVFSDDKSERPSGGVSFELDEFGQEVAGTRSYNDPFVRNAERLPTSQAIRFEDAAPPSFDR